MTFNLSPILAQNSSVMGKFEVQIIAQSIVLGQNSWGIGIKIKYSSLTALGNDFKPTLLSIKGQF